MKHPYHEPGLDETLIKVNPNPFSDGTNVEKCQNEAIAIQSFDTRVSKEAYINHTISVCPWQYRCGHHLCCWQMSKTSRLGIAS